MLLMNKVEAVCVLILCNLQELNLFKEKGLLNVLIFNLFSK